MVRNMSLYRDDRYWDVLSFVSKTPEIIEFRADPDRLFGVMWTTFDGFVIRAVVNRWIGRLSWNGYVQVPEDLTSQVFQNMSDYDNIQYTIRGIPVELTYGYPDGRMGSCALL